MFKNYIKIAFRSLWKNKTFSSINILGLTFGIAAVLLLYRLLSYEWSFNKGFENYDRIVRVVAVEPADEGDPYTPGLPIPAMAEIEANNSFFESTSRIREAFNYLTVPDAESEKPAKKIKTEGIALFTQPSFFEIFDFPVLSGDISSALIEPNSVVLTKTMAEKCFVNWEDALGKTLLLDHIYPLKVTGVLEDVANNRDFNFPYLISYETIRGKEDYLFFTWDQWGSCGSNDQFYGLLKDKNQFEEANAYMTKLGNEKYLEATGEVTRIHSLQAMSELHFDDRYSNSGDHTISIVRLRILAFIGLLILIMACFNFINLSTAQATLRSKEVGVRKTLGSQYQQLVTQFMVETGITVLVAIFLGVTLAAVAAPLLKHISDVPDQLAFLTQANLWAFIAVIGLLVTFLAGLYPSIRLASFKPIEALKNKVSNRKFGEAGVRKALVVIQFLIAQGLIIGIIITLLQLDFIRSKDLGFRADLVYTFGMNADESTLARQQLLKQKILQIPSVEALSFSSDHPLSGNTWSANFRYGSRPEDEAFNINLKYTDADYPKTYGIELVAGEWLKPADTIQAYLVNETLLKKLKIDDPKEAVGQNLRLGSLSPRLIRGVVKDFHTHSLHNQRQPLLMTTKKNFYWSAGVKIKPDQIASTVAAIQSVYDEVLPEQVFDGKFLDEDIARMYQDDDRLSATCWGFGFLAILISCLGLFGLATHAANQRTKEIGIRKVLGASVTTLVSMLSKEFIVLVLIALLVATPLAWYFMQSWLTNFAYSIDIKWWVFAITGISAVFIAFLTVSFQSVKAALANPVDSLRNE